MKEIFIQIVENTKKISKAQECFSLPQINNAIVSLEELETTGATLLKQKYIIENDEGKIEITFESKDKCRAYQVNPDWNKVEIFYTGVNGEKESYFDGWSDKM